MEISKELLTIVLEKEIREFVIEKNELRYILENDTNSIPELYYINIYELAHKCKEWANKQGYKKVYSGIYESTDQGSLYICIISSIEANHTLDFWESTEQEAIFKASQYILDIQVN